MPQTIKKSDDLQIIAGVFSDRKKADDAVLEFQKLGVPAENIQMLLQPAKDVSPKVNAEELQEHGFADSEVAYYDEAIRKGKTFVAVHNVTEPKKIIDVFDRFGAEYNPDGSRNVRQDVSGMTAGAGAGALVGGATGLATAGPVGAAVGAVAGAVIGGGAGAGAGKAIEHNK